MSARMLSSSTAKLSISASVRCANASTSVIAMVVPPSGTYANVTYVPVGYQPVNLRHRGRSPRPRPRRRSAPGARFVLGAGAQVADVAVDQAHHAGLADAHPAAERHPDTGLLAGVHQGGGRVGVTVCHCARTSRRRRCPHPGADRRKPLRGAAGSAKPAAAQSFSASCSMPSGPQAQVGDCASRAPPRPGGTGRGGPRCGWRARSAGSPRGRPSSASSGGEQHVGVGRRGMHVHDVADLAARPWCAASTSPGCPEPAVRNSTAAGPGRAERTRPAGRPAGRSCPARPRRPGGWTGILRHRLDGDEMVREVLTGLDVSE